MVDYNRQYQICIKQFSWFQRYFFIIIVSKFYHIPVCITANKCSSLFADSVVYLVPPATHPGSNADVINMNCVINTNNVINTNGVNDVMNSVDSMTSLTSMPIGPSAHGLAYTGENQSEQLDAGNNIGMIMNMIRDLASYMIFKEYFMKLYWDIKLTEKHKLPSIIFVDIFYYLLEICYDTLLN